jgi:hypothetical protein
MACWVCLSDELFFGMVCTLTTIDSTLILQLDARCRLIEVSRSDNVVFGSGHRSPRSTWSCPLGRRARFPASIGHYYIDESNVQTIDFACRIRMVWGYHGAATNKGSTLPMVTTEHSRKKRNVTSQQVKHLDSYIYTPNLQLSFRFTLGTLSRCFDC